MPLYLFLLLASAVGADFSCPLGQCFVGPEGCVTSGPGVRCVECPGGYRDLLGACVFETFVVETLSPVVIRPLCEDNLKCSQFGKCVPCKAGVLSDECLNRGRYVHPNQCECYDPVFDPKAACQTFVNLKTESVIVDYKLDYVTADAHKNPVMGFYADNPVKKYGAPNPEVPLRCFSSVYGPPPTNTFEVTVPFQACNTFCDADPDTAFGVEKDLSCKTCAYHGQWNATSYSCTCDRGWALSYIGDDFYGNPAKVCSICDGYWGPPPGDEHPPPFCSRPWLPDVDGVLKECSGHGTYIEVDNECVCYSNSTAGYWDRVNVGNFSTCAKCQFGYLLPDCTLMDGQTRAPTRFPTSFSPSESPTRAYSQCPLCPGNSLGLAVVTNPAVEIYEAINTTCCTYESMVLSPMRTLLEVRAENGTCLTSFSDRQALGWALCQQIVNCTAFTFYETANSTFSYYFVNETSVSYTESLVAGSALACLD